MNVFYLKQGDDGPSLEATLLGPDLNPIDLTDATSILFLMSTTPPLSSAATVVSATEGKVRYDWQSGDTDTIGEFKAEFEITWSTGAKQTVPNKGYISVYIAADLN